MKLSIIIFSILITACAPVQQRPQLTSAERYVDVYMPRVERGELKRSDYYKGLYEAFGESPGPLTGEHMLITNGMIDAALKYENNVITKDEYDSIRRDAMARINKAQSEYLIKMQQVEASRPPPEPFVYKPYIRKSPPIQNQPLNLPKQTNCTTYGNQTNCTTY